MAIERRHAGLRGPQRHRDLQSLDGDGDGWLNDDEDACGTDADDPASVPTDTDADGICDFLDTDSDGDGVADIDDAFPYDPNETDDTDGDGVGDNSDDDTDGDGWLDELERTVEPTPWTRPAYRPTSTWT